MTAVHCARCGETWPQGDPALRVACPSCQAPPGRRCHRPSAHECVTAAPAADQAVIAAGASLSESAAINELASALSKAQGAFSNPEKDRRNPHFDSYYATLGAVIEATRKALAENGLSLTQTVGGRPPSLRTRLLHSSGQWLASEMPLFMAGKGSQVFGSELTYMRRYAVCALLNIAPAEGDDDGNAAQVAMRAGASSPQASRGEPRPSNGAGQPARPQATDGPPPRAPAREPARRPEPPASATRPEPSGSPGQPAAPRKAPKAQEAAGTPPRRRKDEAAPPSAWRIVRPGKADITAPDGAAWLKWWTDLAGKAQAGGKRDWLRTFHDANAAAWDEIALASPETEAVVAQVSQAVRAVLDD